MQSKTIPKIGKWKSIQIAMRSKDFSPSMGDIFRKEFGEIVDYNLNGRRYFVTDPELVQTIMRMDYRSALKTDRYVELEPYQGNGPVLSHGPDWIKQRRWTAPFFLKSHFPHYAKIINEEASAVAERLAGINEPFNLVPHLNRLTFRVLCRCLLGTTLDSELDVLYREINNSVALLPKRFYSLIPTPLWFPLPLNNEIRKSGRAYKGAVLGIIKAHKVNDEPGLLNHLLTVPDISENEMVDMLATMIAAGFETTSNLLSWVFALLCQHKDVQTRLRSEMEEEGFDPESSVYLDCVINESLRLYPPVLFPGRKIAVDLKYKDHVFKAGSIFDMNLWTVQRNERFWEHPEEFIPERFFPENLDPKSLQAFAPFAVGPRECVGKHFSLLESKHIIKKLVRTFELNFAADYKLEPEATIVLRPKGGVKVALRKLQYQRPSFEVRKENPPEHAARLF